MAKSIGLLDNLIRAFHGSPHDFDKFSTSKIGTGEGNQAFGHGLYFAEDEAIARNYRDQLSKGVKPEFRPSDIYNTSNWDSEAKQRFPDDREMQAAFTLFNQMPDKSAVLNEYDFMKNSSINKGKPYKWGGVEFTRDRLEDLSDIFYNKGNMYEVGIKASPDEMLDWDLPYSDQSSVVKGAVNNFMQVPFESSSMYRQLRDRGFPHDAVMNYKPAYDGRIEKLYSMINGYADGEEVYRMMERIAAENSKDVSSLLNDNGVKGIRYLDAGSRGAGEGTRNMVVFDDSNVDILKKYLRPETMIGALGIQEQQAQQELDNLMGQYNQFMDRNNEAYNYGELVPLKRSQTGRQGSAAMGAVPVVGKALQAAGYDFSMPTMVDDIVKGLLDIGQSRKTGVVNSGTSLLDALL